MYLTMSEEGKPWETISEPLISTTERLDKLNTGQVYLVTFQKRSFSGNIFFAPNDDESYDNFPEYAEIRISFINSRGRQITNPEPIRDIIYFEIVGKSTLQASSCKIWTTEYMKVLFLLIEIPSKSGNI
ncbi:hypothetical protein RF11_09071 [Thelohanellus kitauei]|uniref:Uncharacterized protein n=1 Tax=Thelohanellus kitauei TaxID=669202 RepID=A0A0C2MFC5_THEKT|nr:hypothetical protein RF11_09071 [Thelohanellus kitauei]